MGAILKTDLPNANDFVFVSLCSKKHKEEAGWGSGSSERGSAKPSRKAVPMVRVTARTAWNDEHTAQRAV